MSHVTNEFLKEVLHAYLVAGSADIRIVPCMTNTTVDAENAGIDTVDDYGTLDEFDGSGYASGGIQLASESAGKDDGDNEGYFDADDVTGLSYGDGTRAIAGLLVIKWDTNLASSKPIAWIDTVSAGDGFPVSGASLASILWDPDGIIRALDGTA